MPVELVLILILPDLRTLRVLLLLFMLRNIFMSSIFLGLIVFGMSRILSGIMFVRLISVMLFDLTIDLVLMISVEPLSQILANLLSEFLHLVNFLLNLRVKLSFQVFNNQSFHLCEFIIINWEGLKYFLSIVEGGFLIHGTFSKEKDLPDKSVDHQILLGGLVFRVGCKLSLRGAISEAGTADSIPAAPAIAFFGMFTLVTETKAGFGQGNTQNNHS